MKRLPFILMLLGLVRPGYGQPDGKPYGGKDFTPKSAAVRYVEDLDLLVFEFSVEGIAGKTVPEPAGKMDGAPVLGYVFPTTLKAGDVGFGKTEGILALAVTAHPDFDDSPIWDENNDGVYDNDGITFHPHWVVLTEDNRVAGKLAVKEFSMNEQVTMPKTSPGLHMYMDSPGYSVVLKGNTGRVLVPAQRVNFKKEFNYDLVACYMEVNTSDKNRPMLGVYQVYGVLSGNLSLPYKVK